MPHYRIQHITKYTYPGSVIDSANQLKLYPVQNANQDVIQHEITITGKPNIEEFLDYFGNRVGVFYYIKPHKELIIQSDIEVITKPSILPEELISPVTQWQYLSEVKESNIYFDFLSQPFFNSYKEMKDIVYSIFAPTRHSPLTAAKFLTEYVYKNFEYKKGITSIETAVDDFWKLKAGVCQDFALLLLVMLRIAGIPARYVSGYICPENHEFRGEGATHAWVEVYIPFHSWIGIDPTNNCLVAERHVKLAIGRNFDDCTPVKGTYKGSGDHTLEVSVTMENEARKKNILKKEAGSFSYVYKKEDTDGNSYRRFMEIQQQQ